MRFQRMPAGRQCRGACRTCTVAGPAPSTAQLYLLGPQCRVLQNGNTTVSALFSNGHSENGTVAPDCSAFTWSDGTVWDAAVPPTPECAAVSSRAPCGQVWDSPGSCQSKGCCWDAAGDASVPCFYQSNAVNITHVHVIQVKTGVECCVSDTRLRALRADPVACAPFCVLACSACAVELPL